ncbi:MAG: SDR family NAD(P)-dependent oxidoreductase, partial [Sphingomonadales bacterium]|nr:SDR family NAD(P)-dependent oxidoreductase [Sphingomonadales bacterium]
MATPLPSVLVTGASTGIGLEFVRQYAECGWRVVATHRGRETPETLVRLATKHPGVEPATMDITKADEVAALARALRAQPLDILINNAGITKDDDGASVRQNFGHYDFGLMDLIFATNVQGPLRVSQAFAEHLAAGQRKLLVTISSTHGSLTGPPGTLEELQGTFYCASKAALNRQMQVIAHV